MMLERAMILPNCDFQNVNEAIPFSKWNMKVGIDLLPFPSFIIIMLASPRHSLLQPGFYINVILENKWSQKDFL